VHQLTFKSAVLRPAQAVVLCAVMVVVAILYIRNSPEPAGAGAEVRTVGAAMAAPDVAPDVTAPGTGSRGADRLLAQSLADPGVQTVTTITPPPEPRSLATAVAVAKAESDAELAAAAAAARSTTTTSTTKAVVTTTTIKPAPTTTTAPAVAVSASPGATAESGVYGSGQSATGTASWFAATDGTCAHPTLPFGTIVKVTRIRTGATATCRVNDRGPYEGGRIIDLSDDVFESLAPKGAGLMPVKIEW
jgi:rare lipoprotein A